MNSISRIHPIRRIHCRVLTVLAGLGCAVAAFAATGPAAFAMLPSPGGATGITETPAAPIRVVTVGGTRGWQITLIAVGAAVLAAAAALLLYRALAGRRSSTATA
jgi:hypothetical protein